MDLEVSDYQAIQPMERLMKSVTLKVDKFSTSFTSVIEGKDGVKTANSRYYLSFQRKREYLEATETFSFIGQ